jgi:hypothetical protein
MLKIKISIPGFADNINISQFVGNDKNIGFDCQFFINNSTLQEADYWFVIENLNRQEDAVCIHEENIYFLSAEVVHEKGYYDTKRLLAFLDQFNHIITCHDIYSRKTKYDLPFLPWMINANHGSSIFGVSTRDFKWFNENNVIDKTKKISVICSDQKLTIDHRLRFKFVTALKKHFGEELDWYGNGINPLPEKWYGIAPYKYHIVIENQSRNNIITEKLYDSFLGMAYPIYYGAPNINKFFDPKSMTQIDIMDLHGSIKKIEEVLKDDKWEEKRSLLIESKQRVLNDYHLFKRIAEISKSSQLYSSKKNKQKISLRSINYLSPKSFGEKLITRTGLIISRISNKLLEMGV